MRIVGLESELALGFEPASPGAPHPPQDQLYEALLDALRARRASCDALYYKGGVFLQNGSLVHFEVSRLDDPRTGLLEWATPECLGPTEAAVYARAAERELVFALEDAERSLAARGHEGRLLLLKNNEDRYGNAYGCHESYDVRERFRPWAWVLGLSVHPLLLSALFSAGLLLSLPVLFALAFLGTLALCAQALSSFPGLRRLGETAAQRLQDASAYLLEPGPRPGSGLVAHLALWGLRGGASLFSISARRVLLTGHIEPLLPFLATRPVFAGAGALGADGRYRLTARAARMRTALAAFVYGAWRPLVDIKEYFFRRPFGYLDRSKRLHVLAGDANRSEYVEFLKLATTVAVLDAVEAGALDALANRVHLLGGPAEAMRRVADDPSLRAVVARDAATGIGLTALDVQRLVLEAVWSHFGAQPSVPAELKNALVRWNFVLDRLADDPRTLDGELDWVIKHGLLSAALHEELGARGWELLAAWGPVNQLLEQVAPHVELRGNPGPAAVRGTLRGALGARRFRRARAHVRAEGLDWGAFPPVRRAYLRLKTIDLKYHELSRAGGYYDWLDREGTLARVLDRAAVERACAEAPARTRARLRGEAVLRAAKDGKAKVRVGWDRVVYEVDGREPRQVRLPDPYAHDPEVLAGEEAPPRC